jgi:hypothetical protein
MYSKMSFNIRNLLTRKKEKSITTIDTKIEELKKDVTAITASGDKEYLFMGLYLSNPPSSYDTQYTDNKGEITSLLGNLNAALEAYLVPTDITVGNQEKFVKVEYFHTNSGKMIYVPFVATLKNITLNNLDALDIVKETIKNNAYFSKENRLNNFNFKVLGKSDLDYEKKVLSFVAGSKD